MRVTSPVRLRAGDVITASATHTLDAAIPTAYIRWFRDIGAGDLPLVGGKNASLGEMIGELAGAGIRVPAGFATTASAYREFMATAGLQARIAERLAELDVEDVAALARAGAEIRDWITAAPLPDALQRGIRKAYEMGLTDGEAFAKRRAAMRPTPRGRCDRRRRPRTCRMPRSRVSKRLS